MPERTRDPIHKYAVGVLIPLKEEYVEICKVLTPVRSFTAEDETFIELRTPGGHTVVAAIVRSMGQEAAAVVTERLVHLGIELLVVIGIAGSLSKEARLADVVVPSVVDLYGNAAKAIPDRTRGFALERAGDPYRLSWHLRQIIDDLTLRPEYASHWCGWRERAAERRVVLGLASDEAVRAGRPEPQLLVGHVASGSEVAASNEFTDWLKRRDRSYLAVEMESGGVSVSANRRAVALPLLVVRGISDYADERKTELEDLSVHWPARAWRRLAAQNAADLVATLVDGGLLPSRSAEPSNEVVRTVHRVLFVALRKGTGATGPGNEMLFYPSRDWQSLPLVPAPELAEGHPRFAETEFVKAIMLRRIGLDAEKCPSLEVHLLEGVKSSTIKRSRDPLKGQLTRYEFRVAWCELPDDLAAQFKSYRNLTADERSREVLGFATLKEVSADAENMAANKDVVHCLEHHFGAHLEIVPPNPT